MEDRDRIVFLRSDPEHGHRDIEVRIVRDGRWTNLGSLGHSCADIYTLLAEAGDEPLVTWMDEDGEETVLRDDGNQ